MNIFRALSQGKGAVNEENTSSFLAYLLNPNEDHGLNNVFLYEFMSSLSKNENLSWISKEIINKNKLNFENKDINVALETSYPVASNDKNKEKCAIDVEVIFSKDGQEQYKFCIENKTKVSSVTTGQLKEEYEAISKERENKNTKIIMVYLTPDDEKCKQEFSSLKTEGKDTAVWLNWYNDENCTQKRTNIKDMISALFEKEKQFAISPMPEYLLHTLKAFIHYLMFPQNKPENIAIEKKFRSYTIRKYNSGRIEVVSDEDKESKTITDYLRKINEQLTSPIDKKACANTRQFGAKILEKLPEK